MEQIDLWDVALDLRGLSGPGENFETVVGLRDLGIILREDAVREDLMRQEDASFSDLAVQWLLERSKMLICATEKSERLALAAKSYIERYRLQLSEGFPSAIPRLEYYEPWHGPELPKLPVVCMVFGDVSPNFTAPGRDSVIPYAFRGEPEEHAVPPNFLAVPWPQGMSGWFTMRARRQTGHVAWRTGYALGHYNKVIVAKEGDVFFSLVSPIDENRPGYFLSGDVDLDVVQGFAAGGCLYNIRRMPDCEYAGRLFQVAFVGPARDVAGSVHLWPDWRYKARKFQRWALLPTPQVLRYYVDRLIGPSDEETIKARWNLIIRCAPEEHKAVLRSWRIAAVEKLDLCDPIEKADALIAASAAARLARGNATRTRC
jgi:hypothetical protein